MLVLMVVVILGQPWASRKFMYARGFRARSANTQTIVEMLSGREENSYCSARLKHRINL